MEKLDERAHSVTQFWRDAGPEAWFRKDTGFDVDFKLRFLDLHYSAARRECDEWVADAEGALALMILLDQFPRNCFRQTAHMFATDSLARHFARTAISLGHDEAVDAQIRVFFYLPFEHSEDITDQRLSMKLHEAKAQSYLEYATLHRDIIEQFGHFPHRNQVLGRQTTQEEQAFLDKGGFSG